MKLSTKLIASFSGVVILLLIIGGTSQYLNREIRTKIVQENQEAIRKLELSGEMGLQLYRSLVNIQYFLEDRYRRSLNEADYEPDLDLKRAEMRVREAMAGLRTNITRFGAVLNAGAEMGRNNKPEVDTLTEASNVELLKMLETRFELYNSLVDELITLAKNDYEDGKEFFTITIEPYFRTNILPLVDRLRGQTRENLDVEIDELNSQLNEASTSLLVGTVAAFLLSVILAIILYRSVATPLKTLKLAVQHIGEGNLDERVEVSSSDEIGDLADEFNRMVENLSKTTVSKNLMDDIIESMGDALIVMDNKGNIERINSATMQMFGYSESQILGRPLGDFFEDEFVIPESVQNGVVHRNREGRIATNDGSNIPVSYSLGRIHDSHGEKRGIVCVATDITHRKEAEEEITKSLKEKEILLSEIHHRVKNNLAVISGLLQMQIWETEYEAAEVALKDSQLRVQSIALIHEKLYQSEKLSYIRFDNYIHELLKAIQNMYRKSGAIEVKTDLTSIALNINQAIPCSLLLNELTVNAYKYAFDREKGGTIHIQLRKEDDTVRLAVEDDGVGLPDDFSVKSETSLGMSLVKTLVKQLKGELEIEKGKGKGTKFQITFEAEPVF